MTNVIFFKMIGLLVYFLIKIFQISKSRKLFSCHFFPEKHVSWLAAHLPIQTGTRRLLFEKVLGFGWGAAEQGWPHNQLVTENIKKVCSSLKRWDQQRPHFYWFTEWGPWSQIPERQTGRKSGHSQITKLSTNIANVHTLDQRDKGLQVSWAFFLINSLPTCEQIWKFQHQNMFAPSRGSVSFLVFV